MVFEIEFEDPLKKIMVLLYFCDQLGEYIMKQYGFQSIKPIQDHSIQPANCSQYNWFDH